jgi:hypothetical protein
MTSSEDRWVYPARGVDPREIDRETTDAEKMAERETTRNVSHDQEPVRSQGLTSDKPGVDVSEREESERGLPTTD